MLRTRGDSLRPPRLGLSAPFLVFCSALAVLSESGLSVTYLSTWPIPARRT